MKLVEEESIASEQNMHKAMEIVQVHKKGF